MKQPKEKLKEIYDEYLAWKENNKGRHFYQYLASNKYTLAFTVLKIQKNLAEECGFSTTSECRKAINELENWQPVSDKITKSTENSEYTVYIPESAKKTKEETWQDIFDEWTDNGIQENNYAVNLLNWLKENFEVPKRK